MTAEERSDRFIRRVTLVAIAVIALIWAVYHWDIW